MKEKKHEFSLSSAATQPLAPIAKKNEQTKKNESSWDKFIENAKEYNANGKTDKGVQIWLNSDLKDTLDYLKISGIKIPVRHLLSAAVKTFLEENKDNVEKYTKRLKEL